MRQLFLVFLSAFLYEASALDQNSTSMVTDYFIHKQVRYGTYFSCENSFKNKLLVKELLRVNIRMAVSRVDCAGVDLKTKLQRYNGNQGVIVDGSCVDTRDLLYEASVSSLFDLQHMWLVLLPANYSHKYDVIDAHFASLNLSVETDVAVAFSHGSNFELHDVFNFGKIQGNHLEKIPLGVWRMGGFNFYLTGFKYYNRWDFHNLTLRAVTVISDKSQAQMFTPEMLSDVGFTKGVSVRTKIAAQLLQLLKEQHNFRFNYTVAGRWIGMPDRNATLAVSNSLYWREQDLSATCTRLFTKWLDWVDPFFPPVTQLETKFFYLIPDKGAGDYENRFLTPMAPSVWWVSITAGGACALVLATFAMLEARSEPGLYAFFSVFAAFCQQAYEDGVQILDGAFSSQGRRLTLLVIGLTSMLLYNYYTSSVVSWLLNAAAPTIASMDGLIKSDLELIFEDVGYTRGWLDNAGFYYYSGSKNVKEDELRSKKVTNVKRSVPLLQPPEQGIALVRGGGYAYHTEPYTAGRVISRTFEDRDLCNLGALQMMQPAHVYIMGQRRSPYKQFFVWSMLRLLERGHVKVSRARFFGHVPQCSGSTPRALALGQAAPAFLLLLEAAILSALILAGEKIWYKFQEQNKHR